ncbi:MAG: 30S ribosomal protein S20 [Desulfobacteraceae bacterium]|nr:30S ribosomal protein S20 [Desulfobacteraceae bacterium]
MANHKSALKRTRQNINRRLRNKAVRTQVKSATKRLEAKVVEKDLQLALDELKSAKSTIAKAAKKGVLHRNTASRKISRLERMVNTLNP